MTYLPASSHGESAARWCSLLYI